ncbi:MAG: rhodanese-like domain-containing protein [Planctomycetaceae bacterium]|nr:rhodanese-like domain-containing protein [Planctomycetaceae bacterium]
MRFVPVICLATLVSFGLPVMASSAEHTKDSLETVKMNVESRKAVLIDVREQDEWDAGHLAQATHVPLSRIQKGLTAEDWDKLVPKDAVVYLHCAAGARCLKASDVLPKSAHELRPLKPGYRELLKAGFVKAEK